MNKQRILVGLFALVCLLILTAVLSQAQAPQPQHVAAPQAAIGTTFTYQGYLRENGGPASGTFDFQFILYDASSGGSQVGSTIYPDDVTVSDGLFSVVLDFGDVFDGTQIWLEPAVRAGDSTGSYTVLSPRQELTPAPYALYAINIPLAGDGSASTAARSDHGHDARYYTETELNTSGGGGSVHWDNLGSVPAGFADGIDANSGGDITAVTAGTGLSGGGTYGSVTLHANLEADGYVRAGVFAYCADTGSSIHRYFHIEEGEVSVGANPIGHYCYFGFEFDLSNRYWVATSPDGNIPQCWEGTSTRIHCRLYKYDGSTSDGDIMLLVY
jgi:hypothetical protein